MCFFLLALSRKYSFLHGKTIIHVHYATTGNQLVVNGINSSGLKLSNGLQCRTDVPLQPIEIKMRNRVTPFRGEVRQHLSSSVREQRRREEFSWGNSTPGIYQLLESYENGCCVAVGLKTLGTFP